MRSLRTAAVGGCALVLALGGTVPLAAQAGAEPCGHESPSSSGLGSGGSFDFLPDAPKDVLPDPGPGPTRTVAWVTGPRSDNRTDARFSVSGTDLAIMWDNGAAEPDRRILMAFGDTFGDCAAPGEEWRHNVLMRSADTDLTDGIDVPDPVPGDIHAGSPVDAHAPDFSRELVGALGIEGIEKTVIPTAGIAVGGVQYINFMSVRAWGDHGEWWTNASMIGTSVDNGETWHVDPATARLNVPLDIPGVQQLSMGNANFQQHAYVRHDGYLYDFGTPQGRFGAAFLSRVPEHLILDLTAYEYWTADGWIPGDVDRAVPIIPGTVGELSVHFTGDQFVMVYGNDVTGGIDLRTSPSPEGPWSEPRQIVARDRLGGIYAPFIHPWSTGNDLYFTASRWSDYNVMLLHTTVSG
ncbi:DUF4185 domain-containing protein [Rhodococcus artemisiae]|uniref:DUF4185 domain-containing protein n=1 Tax=Rhodococcus artemisiae TaxID=714159 RepID=A0ABU7LID2_9NOCA|nr:DUF4185 domain-containing protein [Rhodococcus artemisiae]MEE2061298.1 DUF4185 domain-containing protein [Rhodococcus artemisiae]